MKILNKEQEKELSTINTKKTIIQKSVKNPTTEKMLKMNKNKSF